jgi:anti-sigma regulatory factor (Ser/Thr protein kinase)
MCELTLAAVATAVPCARIFVRHHLRGWGVIDDVITVAELMVSELVTNAAKATGTTEQLAPLAFVRARFSQIVVRLRLTSQSIFVEVWHCDARPPLPSRADPHEESGRGLFLVTVLAEGWGYFRVPGGKAVWCELRRAEQGQEQTPGIEFTGGSWHGNDREETTDSSHSGRSTEATRRRRRTRQTGNGGSYPGRPGFRRR